jgi:hypothetical protein
MVTVDQDPKPFCMSHGGGGGLGGDIGTLPRLDFDMFALLVTPSLPPFFEVRPLWAVAVHRNASVSACRRRNVEGYVRAACDVGRSVAHIQFKTSGGQGSGEGERRAGMFREWGQGGGDVGGPGSKYCPRRDSLAAKIGQFDGIICSRHPGSASGQP